MWRSPVPQARCRLSRLSYLAGLPTNSSSVVSDCEGVRTGESCHQYCAVGYENTTEEANFVCQSNGQAAGGQTQCQPIACESMSTNFSYVQHTCRWTLKALVGAPCGRFAVVFTKLTSGAGSIYSRSCFASCAQGYSGTPEQWTCGDASMGPELGFEVYKGITLRGMVPNCSAAPCAPWRM